MMTAQEIEQLQQENALLKRANEGLAQALGASLALLSLIVKVHNWYEFELKRQQVLATLGQTLKAMEERPSIPTVEAA
jgi:hypothetical protein